MDIEGLRRDTPGLEHRIHLNSAGASLMPQPVIDAVRDHFDLEVRIGGYEAADEAAAFCRDLVAKAPRARRGC